MKITVLGAVLVIAVGIAIVLLIQALNAPARNEGIPPVQQ